jgi:hypothetical protein
MYRHIYIISYIYPYIIKIGASLDSNVALILNNAKVAAQIACHHSELLKSETFHSLPSPSSTSWLSSLSFPSSSSSTEKRFSSSEENSSQESSHSPSYPPSKSKSKSNSVRSEINDWSENKIPIKNKDNNVLIFGAAIVDIIASPSGLI